MLKGGVPTGASSGHRLTPLRPSSFPKKGAAGGVEEKKKRGADVLLALVIRGILCGNVRVPYVLCCAVQYMIRIQSCDAVFLRPRSSRGFGCTPNVTTRGFTRV